MHDRVETDHLSDLMRFAQDGDVGAYGRLLREITPAHLQIITSYSEGFLIGISRIGIEPIGGTL